MASRDGASVRARRGTKSTQGINGEAALLKRFTNAVAVTGGPAAPCPYDEHRATDWQLAEGGPRTCGICHPPARGLNVTQVPA